MVLLILWEGSIQSSSFLRTLIEFPSYDLRYLCWERYPLESLPSSFDGENLVELNLMNKNIKRLWQREKVAFIFSYILSSFILLILKFMKIYLLK